MPLSHNKKLLSNVRNLRSNMTEEERKLWHLFLKRLPVNVNRQKNIGNYIVDFYIHSHHLVIEIDGRQHLLQEHQASDNERDRTLEALGITVLRYSNQSVNSNFSAVCEDILRRLGLSATDLK